VNVSKSAVTTMESTIEDKHFNKIVSEMHGALQALSQDVSSQKS